MGQTGQPERLTASWSGCEPIHSFAFTPQVGIPMAALRSILGALQSIRSVRAPFTHSPLGPASITFHSVLTLERPQSRARRPLPSSISIPRINHCIRSAWRLHYRDRQVSTVALYLRLCSRLQRPAGRPQHCPQFYIHQVIYFFVGGTVRSLRVLTTRPLCSPILLLPLCRNQS